MLAAVSHVLHPPVVLVYHGVNDLDDADDPVRLVLSPTLLASQVRWLLGRRYRFLTAEELLAETSGGAPPPRTAVLTFDDGWRDAVTVAAPLLTALGVRATFYVNPGRWGGQHPDVIGTGGRLLDESEAHALLRAGMELGAHTMTHPDLRLLDDDTLRWELVESRAAVQRVTGRACRTFAYPYGLFDERVEAAVREAGYELAFAWQPGVWGRPLAAPRLPAPPRAGARRLALKLHGVRVPPDIPRPLSIAGVGRYLAGRLTH